MIHVSTYLVLFSFNQAALCKWCEECSSEICLAHFSAEVNEKTPQLNLEVIV